MHFSAVMYSWEAWALYNYILYHSVDGGWTTWYVVSNCSVPCGNDTLVRTCSNPFPAHGGKPCEGPV